MATLSHLHLIGALIKHEAYLEDGEMPERFVYHDPAMTKWLQISLPSFGNDRSRNLTPLEQVELILYEFIIKKPMRYGQDDRKLDPLKSHIWEIKTKDVRLIGWFPCKATFVMVCGEMRKNLKNFAAYTPFIAKSIAFRSSLDLDHPKMLEGATHSDVL